MVRLEPDAPMSETHSVEGRGNMTVRSGPDAIHAELEEGFHFNAQAPNRAHVDGSMVNPSVLRGRIAEFSALPSGYVAARLHLFVCDDAVTFCEPRLVEINGSAAASSTVPSGLVAKIGAGRPNKHGFIEDDLEGALALARREGKLLLVDFAARWCPGCIRYESETFGAAKFKTLTREFVKVKFDLDRFENSVLTEKFAVKAIPTLMVMTADQEEVARLMDYQPFQVLAPFLEDTRKYPTPLAALMAGARSDDMRANLRVGKRLVAAGRFEESLGFLTRLQPPPPELWTARVGLAERGRSVDQTHLPEFRRVLRDAISAEPRSVRSLSWRTLLITDSDDKLEIQRVLDEGLALAADLLADSKLLRAAVRPEHAGEFNGYEPLLVALSRADLVEAARVSSAMIRQAWSEAADVGARLRIRPMAEGMALRYLFVLNKAERFAMAENLAKSILKNDRGNPEIERRLLVALVGQRKFTEAVELGKACLRNSYGRNEFWVAESLAKAHFNTGQKEEARRLLKDYLSRPDANWPNMRSTKKSMEELLAKFGG